MSSIKKFRPSEEIVALLTKEIQEFGLQFAKEQKPSIYTKAAFDKLIIPENNEVEKILFSTGTFNMDRKASLNIIKVGELLNANQSTNTLFYTQKSCMPWHTNSDNLGLRTYIVFTTNPGIFRYKDPHTGEIIDDYDYVGWTQREFRIDKNNLLWHAVYSPGSRFSYGFNTSTK